MLVISSVYTLLQKLKRLQQKRSLFSKQHSFHGDESEALPTLTDSVQAVKEDGTGRRRKRRKITNRKKRVSKKDDDEQYGMETQDNVVERNEAQDKFGTETVVNGMEAWHEMTVPIPIIRALKDLGFTIPTEIQQRAIPVAMDTTHDVIGAAETVSQLILFRLKGVIIFLP